MKKIYLIIFLLLFTTRLIGQNDSLKTKEVVNKTTNITEARAYQLLYENSNKTNEKILTTIYWSLGGMFTIVLAIIGSTIFFNFRFNKREIENITNDAITKIEIAKNTFSSQIEEKLNNYIQESQKSINEEEKNLTNNYNELLKNFSGNLESQINLNKELYSEKIEQLKKIIELNSKSELRRIEKLENSLNKKIKQREVKLNNNEAELWNLRNVPSNALRAYMKECSLGFEVNQHYLFELRLDKMLECIEQISEIDKYMKDDINNFLSKIPSDNNKEKETFSKSLEKFK